MFKINPKSLVPSLIVLIINLLTPARNFTRWIIRKNGVKVFDSGTGNKIYFGVTGPTHYGRVAVI